MFDMLLAAGALVCGLMALRAKRLLMTALWLVGVTVFTSILLYLVGAYEVAVIELSVGAGLVTILFVFAIAIAGEDAITAPAVVPRWLSGAVLGVVLLLLGWMVWPFSQTPPPASEVVPFSAVLWQNRALDMLVQVGLIFAGVMGVLGLLAEEPAPEKQRQAKTVTLPVGVITEGEI